MRRLLNKENGNSRTEGARRKVGRTLYESVAIVQHNDEYKKCLIYLLKFEFAGYECVIIKRLYDRLWVQQQHKIE